jgi:hypothetical protein
MNNKQIRQNQRYVAIAYLCFFFTVYIASLLYSALPLIKIDIPIQTNYLNSSQMAMASISSDSLPITMLGMAIAVIVISWFGGFSMWRAHNT